MKSSKPPRHKATSPDLDPLDDATPSVVDHSSMLWPLFCQPTFARISTDLASIRKALFVGDADASVLAQLHSHSKMISLLLVIQLALLTALLSVAAFQINTAHASRARVTHEATSTPSQKCDIEKGLSALDR